MIRKANSKDKEQINKLGILLNDNFEKLFDLDDMLKHDYNKIYVYVENDKIVGFIMALVLYETCEILNIVTDPDYRNKKIASNLLDNVISEFENVKTMTLEVDTKNESAINLYKKFGFEIISTRKNYYKNNDAYLMGVTYE